MRARDAVCSFKVPNDHHEGHIYQQLDPGPKPAGENLKMRYPLQQFPSLLISRNNELLLMGSLHCSWSCGAYAAPEKLLPCFLAH